MALEYVIRCRGERVNEGVTEGADEVPTAYLEGSIDLEAGAVGTATFTLPPGHPWNEDGMFRTCDPRCEVTISERYGDHADGADRPEVELFRGWVTETAQDGDLRMRVDCEGVLAYLKTTVVRPYACIAQNDLPDGTTIVNGDPFEWLLEQHAKWAGPDYAFERGHLCRTGPVEAGTDFKSTWDEMNEKFCTGKDRFLHARTGEAGERLLDLLDGGAGESTQAIVVGENVLEFSFGRHDRETVTAIVARGTRDDTGSAGRGDRIDRREFGLEGADFAPYPGRCSRVHIEGDRAVNWDMVEAYGYREEKRDYDAKTPEALALMACQDLDPVEIDERAVQSIDVTAIDLHALNPRVQPIRLLDWVEVYIRADGMRAGDAQGRTIFHGWLPCTKVHIDLANPEDSTYHLGDLEATMTRRSALRLGMLKRATGGLVRRADATPWDNDRVWNRTDSVEEESKQRDEEIREELGQAADDWSQHLDEETARWYESLDEAQKADAQGREELLKHIDEVEGRWDDSLGKLEGDVDDKHKELLAGIRDVAQNAQRTFYGVCRTVGGTAHKVVDSSDLTQPGGESFVLAKGVVVEILFQNGNTAASPQLSIANTGVAYIVTNGDRIGLWQDGELVRFVYDGTYWQCCSVDIYGDSLTVGNPGQANFHTDGYAADLRIGRDSYVHAGMDGARVGLLSANHIDIGDSTIAFENVRGTKLEIGYEDSRKSSRISDTSGVYIDGGAGYTRLGNNYASVYTSTTLSGGAALSCGTGGDPTVFAVTASGYATNARPWVMRSIVAVGTGETYLDVTNSQLGITSSSGYAFAVTNGDIGAQNRVVTGTAVGSAGITVTFNDAVSGRIRLNVLGVPVGAVSTTN